VYDVAGNLNYKLPLWQFGGARIRDDIPEAVDVHNGAA
jgi:hypothetical protein